MAARMAQDSCPHAPAAAATSLATTVSYSAGVDTKTRVQRHDFVSITTLASMLLAASVVDAKNAVRGAEALQELSGQPPRAAFAAMRRNR